MPGRARGHRRTAGAASAACASFASVAGIVGAPGSGRFVDDDLASLVFHLLTLDVMPWCMACVVVTL
jgi:hypothetical protein